MSTNRTTLIVVAALVGVLMLLGCGGVWLTLNWRAKAKYDEVRAELVHGVYREAVLDDGIRTILADAKQHWAERISDPHGEYAQALALLGRAPNVDNVVDVLTTSLPEYSYFSPAQNRDATMLGMVQAIVFGIGDRNVYVSPDRQQAVICIPHHEINLLTNTPSGLHQVVYVKRPKSMAPESRRGAASTGSQ